jgi:hypothetical protein
MNIGMLWFDNDPKTEINSKIERAASYYRDKYGKSPNLCFVHPTMVGVETPDEPATTTQSGDISVRTSLSVLPNHFWIGVNGTKTPAGA